MLENGYLFNTGFWGFFVLPKLRGHPFMTSTRRGRGQAQVDACGWGRGSAPCGCPQQKLEPTDDILSSSHARKLVIFVPEFSLWTE